MVICGSIRRRHRGKQQDRKEDQSRRECDSRCEVKLGLLREIYCSELQKCWSRRTRPCTHFVLSTAVQYSTGMYSTGLCGYCTASSTISTVVASTTRSSSAPIHEVDTITYLRSTQIMRDWVRFVYPQIPMDR